MSNKLEELKRIQAQKKELADQQKALREELDQGKEERKAARKAQAAARKDIREHKSALRDASATIYDKFSKGTPEELNQLADTIMESATELAGAVRSFAKSAEQLEEL